jgi:hypothetical protein
MSDEVDPGTGAGPRGYRLTVRLVTGEAHVSIVFGDLAVAEQVARLSLLDGDVESVELHEVPENLLLETYRR